MAREVRFVAPASLAVTTFALLVAAVLPAEARQLGRSAAESGGRYLEATVDPLSGNRVVRVLERDAVGGALRDGPVLLEEPPGSPGSGHAVSLDGDVAAVADPGRRLVHVYRADARGTWREEATIMGPRGEDGDRFGHWVLLDRGTLIAGAPGAGRAHVYRQARGGTWKLVEWVDTTSALALLRHDREGEVRRLVDLAAWEAAHGGGAHTGSRMPGGSPDSDSLFVVASDSLFENRVAIRWPASSVPATRFRIFRNGVRLSIAASTDSLYEDFTGTPGVAYDYCVVKLDGGTGATLDSLCNEGSRIINAPTATIAGDGVQETRVPLSWRDNSGIEAGYRVYRDGLIIGSTAPNAQAFDDTSAVPGVAATYCVEAFDPLGNASHQACDAGFRGFILPPLNVRATDGQDTLRVIITWVDQAAHETGYRIRRDGTLIGSVAPGVTEFRDSTAVNGVTHEYCVATVDLLDRESIPGCDAGGRGILAAPQSVAASDDTYDDKVVIRWSDPADTEDGFWIRRDGAPIDTLGAGVTTFTDTGATPGVTHTYCVTAFSLRGGVSQAACDIGRQSVVLAPTNVQATDGTREDRVIITWESTSTTAVVYNIYRDDMKGDTTLVASLSRGARSAIDRDIPSARFYRYLVRAMTAQEVESEAGVDSTGSRLIRPPTSVSATDEGFETETRISWVDNSSVELGYHIYRRPWLGLEELVGTRPANRTSFIDASAIPGVSYVYSVAAFDSLGTPDGESEWVSDSGRRALIAPTGLAASQGAFETRVELAWEENSGAERGYRIRRSSAGGAPEVIGETGRNARAFVDTNPGFGLDNDYFVTAFDSLGESLPDSARGMTAIRPPGALRASDGYPDRVALAWVDNSAIEQGCRIYRDDVLIGTTAPGVTSYADLTAAGNVTYLYRVAAFVDAAASFSQPDNGTSPALAIPDILADVRMVTSVTDTAGAPTPLRVPAAGDAIGSEIAISGNWMVAGAIETGRSPEGAGEVWLFERVGATWIPRQFIDNPAGGAGTRFGWSVAIDGDVLVIGSPRGDANAGTAFVWERNAAQNFWYYKQEIFSPTFADGGEYGDQVAVAGDWIMIGAPGETSVFPRAGAVHAWKRDASTGVWQSTQRITEPIIRAGHRFGRHLAMEGGLAVIAAGNGIEGADAWTYVLGASWVPEPTSIPGAPGITTERVTGLAVDSGRLVVARTADAPGRSGTVSAYQRIAGSWQFEQLIGAPCSSCGFAASLSEGGGRSVALEGSTLLVSAPTDRYQNGAAGAAYVYRHGSGGWSPSGRLVAPDRSGDAEWAEVGSALAALPFGASDWADYDGDGDLDLLVSGGSAPGRTTLYRNDGRGRFTDATAGLPACTLGSVDWGDYDRDGDPDILLTGFVSASPLTVLSRVYRNDGGSFIDIGAGLPGLYSGHAAWGDYDTDGDLDILLAGNNGVSGYQTILYRNNGGTFTQVGSGLPGGGIRAEWGDFDNDGDPDVLLTRLGASAAIYRNNGGVFSDIGAGLPPTYSSASFARWGDYDNDGDLDVLVGGGAPGAYDARIYRNNAGVFTVTADAFSPSTVVPAGDWADYDGDGDLDVILAWPVTAPPRLYRNHGGGFTDVGSPGGATQNYPYFAWGDIDNDGRLGFAFSGDASVRIFRQTGDGFGGSVALGQGTAAAGAMGDNNGFGINAGSASVRQLVTLGAGDVAATDGTMANQVKVTWRDLSPDEDGFKVYRDGILLSTTSANSQAYSDPSAEPGRIYEYGVSAYSAAGGESPPVTDPGRRPPNGSITGRITTFEGGSVSGVRVALQPSQNDALLFDGEGGLVRVENPVMPDSAFTIEFWARATEGTMLGYAADAASGVDQIRIWNPSALRVQLGTRPGTLDTGLDIADGAWHHVALTWQRGGMLRLYVDGTPRDSTSGSPSEGLLPSGGVLMFGQDQDLVGGGLDPAGALLGGLDEVRLWGRARTAAEIAASVTQRIAAGAEGLLAYWPFDEGSGASTADLADRSRYGTLENGVFWTGEGAPLDVFAVTDPEGNYTLGGVRYGTSTSFRVAPTDSIRSFSPAFKSITLSEGNPVQNEVGFYDVTSLTVSGYVPFEGGDCFVSGADILVDGAVAGQTRADGTFSVSVQMGTRTIEPRLAGHAFDPPRLVRSFTDDLSGVVFADTTRHQLSGRIGGGSGDCTIPIGRVVVQFTALNRQCLVEVDTLDTADRTYNLRLPAQKYSADVIDIVDVPAGILKADLLEFFANLGGREFDLTAADTTMDFVYRAPATVIITGLPSPPAPCGTDTLGAGVIAQTQRVPLTIRVVEDYGEGGACPVDSGVVVVYDEIMDEESEPVEVPVERGIARYTTAGNNPFIFPGRLDAEGRDRSYQKYITATFSTPGRGTVGDTQWAIVTGHRARESTIITGTTENILATVIRQPPGDGSSAALATGTSFCSTTTNGFLGGGGAGAEVKIDTGIEFEKGLGVTFETKLGVNFQFELEAGASRDTSRSYESCVTTDNEWATSGEDVFIGNAYNLRFAETDIISVEDCRVRRSQGVAWDMDPENAVATAFAFTESHIRDELIPTLTALQAADTLGVRDIFYQQSIENWQAMLDVNDALKQNPVSLIGNRTFSAGAQYASSVEASGQTTIDRETKVYFNGKAGFGFEFAEGGSGSEGLFYGTWTTEWTSSTSSASGGSRTESFTLADDDPGDFFSVDLYRGGGYGTKIGDGTTIFKSTGGRSSCPWEPGTQPRDGVVLSSDRQFRTLVPPDQPATFVLTMINNSQSDETRDYILRPIQTSNPGGAILRLNGDPFNDGLRFTLAPGQAYEALLTVQRGPTRYRYDDLQIEMLPPCEDGGSAELPAGATFALADTVTLDVDFKAPCSEIALALPQPGWVLNASAPDSLPVRLGDFALTISARDTILLESVGAQYRRAGTDDLWTQIKLVPRDSIRVVGGIPDVVEFPWDVSAIDDGAWELRAFTRCVLMPERVYSEAATGVIDRQSPRPFGRPEPADSIYALGDGISIRFNEPIDCNSVDPGDVRLVVVNPETPGDSLVFITVDCDGQAITITPNAAEFATLEGKTLRAHVHGVSDLAGNPMTSSDGSLSYAEWTFEFKRSSFTWAQASLLVDVPYRARANFEAVLVNGTAADDSFRVTDLPGWLTVTPARGLVRAGQSFPLRFDTPDTLRRDESYVHNVKAVTGTGLEIPLGIRLDVACQPAAWVVNSADWQYSMNVTAVLAIPGQVVEAGDVIAAYVGRQLRGLAHPRYDDDLGGYVVYLTVYSNRLSGETVRFQVFDQSDCRLYAASDQTVHFVSDGRAGSPTAPLIVTAVATPPGTTQQINLAEGWSWFSLNLESAEDMSIEGVFGDLNPEAGDIVKSQTQFSQFDPEIGWVGTLTEFDVTSGYQIRLTTPGAILHSGVPLDPSATPVPLADGWNWIGYTPSGTLEVNAALAGLTPKEGDLIKGQAGYAQWVEDSALEKWLGDLGTLAPGRGYKLYMTNARLSQNRLIYPGSAPPAARPDAAGRLAQAAAAPAAATPPASPASGGDSRWQVNPFAWQHNMPVTATFDLPAGYPVNDGMLVGAFVDGTIRGMARPQYVPELGTYMAFLVVYSNEPAGEIMTLWIRDGDREAMFRGAGAITFDTEGSLGTLSTPMAIHGEPTDGDPFAPGEFALFQNEPNPFNPVTSIRYWMGAAGHVSIRIYDVQGRLVLTPVDGYQPAGRYQVVVDANRLGSGVFFYRMSANGFEDVRKMTLVR